MSHIRHGNIGLVLTSKNGCNFKEKNQPIFLSNVSISYVKRVKYNLTSE